MQHEGLTPEQLQALRLKLPSDYGKSIAKMTGYTRGYVYMVANGKCHNEKIIKKMIDLAARHMAKIRKTQEATDHLLQSIQP